MNICLCFERLTPGRIKISLKIASWVLNRGSMSEKKKARRNIYTHEIDLIPLKVKNQDREGFRANLEKIKYRGYEVEQIQDGRKIVITKPGGKFVYGAIRRDDFMVWIYDPKDNSLWMISHKNILNDLQEK